MATFPTIKKYLLLISLIHFAFSSLCTEGNFETLNANDIKELKISKGNEMCFIYTPSEKQTIALKFKLANCYTGEVVIYKSKSDISLKDNVYENAFEKYSLAKYPFKEIDISSFSENVYIIIRDTSKYFFTDFMTLYDSEQNLILKEGEPLIITHFMSNNHYSLQFKASKDINVVFSSKTTFDYEIELKFEDKDLKYDDNFNENFTRSEIGEHILILDVYKLESEEGDDDENEYELSFIVYEKSGKEVKKLIQDEVMKTNYINSKQNQAFYYVADVSEFSHIGTVNFKLDYNEQLRPTININAKLVDSEEEITNFDEMFPIENKLDFGYDYDSDEYYKIYFTIESKLKYKYILISMSVFNINYISPKYWTISLGQDQKIIELYDIPKYVAKEIKIEASNYIPVYVKLYLDPDSKYLLSSPYQDETLLIDGDLLKYIGRINRDFIKNENDIVVFKDVDELTIRITSYEFNHSLFIEKIDENTIIKEGDRTNEPFEIEMTDDNCNYNLSKYIIGNYNKNKYSSGVNLFTAYGTVEEGDIKLYYKNTLDIDELSLFPTSAKNQKELDKLFVLSNNIDLYTITCKKPGVIEIRPIKKTYEEITHLIPQNTFKQISLKTESEILQLSSGLGDKTVGVVDYIYLSILSISGDEILISPLTKGLFNETKIKGNELFAQKIDIDEYKMDELVVNISGIKGASFEVIEVAPQKYFEYKVINDNKKVEITKNNFVQFITKNISKFVVNVEGLENVNVSYGIVQLATDDINYLPPAYQFLENIQKKTISKKEKLEIQNNYYQKVNEKKKYQALVFSIISAKTDFKYSVQIESSDGKSDVQSNLVMNVFLSVAIVLALIIAIATFILIRRRKGLNVENMDNNNIASAEQPLYPNQGDTLI